MKLLAEPERALWFDKMTAMTEVSSGVRGSQAWPQAGEEKATKTAQDNASTNTRERTAEDTSHTGAGTQNQKHRHCL